MCFANYAMDEKKVSRLNPCHPLDLSPELQKMASEEVNENLETRKEAIEQLRKLVQKEKNLHSRLDDAFLVRFLRAGMYNVDAAFKNVQDYYKIKLNHPEIFLKSSLREIDHVYDCNLHLLLPETDIYGSPVVLMRFGAWDPRKIEYDDVTAGMVLLFEHLQKYTELQIKGLNCIVDMKGAGFQHLRAMTLSRIKLGISLFEECFPFRYRVLHVINETIVFNILFRIAKQFMSSRILQVMKIHGTNLNAIYEEIPRHLLPEEIGGTAGPMNSTHSKKLINEDEEILNDLQYGYRQEQK